MILITGGAGYVGSHTAAELDKKKIIIFDNLTSGNKKAVKLLGCKFIVGDLSNLKLLNHIFRKYNIDSVMHFAASSLVGESQTNPFKYYKNNVINGLNLIHAMVKNDVKCLIFSSTASVYGNPIKIPIDEHHPTQPTNNYGITKLIFEKILKYYDANFGLKFVSLRYFNAAGGHPNGVYGEDHKNETHLIPVVLQAALGKLKHVKIFGTTYPTKDGTCIRDYIHVTDLAQAHILAMKSLKNSGKSVIYNLGNEKGFSVREVINRCVRIINKRVIVKEAGRRQGDPPILIASSRKIKKELGWKPNYSSLDYIIESAWKWQRKNPNGYKN